VNRCVAAGRCRAIDGEGYAAPVDRLPLCERCMADGLRYLDWLVWDYVDLEGMIPRWGVGGEKVSGTPEPSVPIALAPEALQRRIWLTLTTWEEIVRDHLGLSELAPGSVRDGWAVQRAVKFLRVRLDELAAVGATPTWLHGPDDEGPVEMTGAEAIQEFIRLGRSARAMLGLTRLTHVMPGACVSCGQTALQREDGSDTVYCTGCQNVITLDDYERTVTL
jgi:hypothetical protein